MVCVGGGSSAQASHDPDVIHVSEDFPQEDEKPPFAPKEEVKIRTNAKFEQYYDLDKEPIGEGKFGQVYRCTEKSTGLELAAKFIKLRKDGLGDILDADREQVEHEVAVMTQMRHPRIAQIYDAFYTTTNDVILVMELVKGGELFNRVAEDNYVLTETAAVMIICQLCEALDYIHTQNILHLDIKPENIMCVTETGNRIKLIDFGLAKHYDGSEALFYMAGTPEFAAPEVIKFEPLDFHTDMWSVGVITYILLSGLSPFLGENNSITYNNVERGEWEFEEEFDCVSETGKDFISKLLIPDKSKRMLPKECLAHPWIADVRARAQKDIILDQPNIGQPINTDRLRSYNLKRKFRKATFAVMCYVDFSQMLGRVRVTNSKKEELAKKLAAANKKTALAPAPVFSPKNLPNGTSGIMDVCAAQETKNAVADIVGKMVRKVDKVDVSPKPPAALKKPVRERKVELPSEKKIQKTESNDSTKENKDSANRPKISITQKITNTTGLQLLTPRKAQQMDLPPTLEAETPKKKTIGKKKKSDGAAIDEASPSSSSEPQPKKKISVKKSVDSVLEAIKPKKSLLKKSASNPVDDHKEDEKSNREIRKTSTSSSKTDSVTTAASTSTKNGETIRTLLKKTVANSASDEKPIKVEMAADFKPTKNFLTEHSPVSKPTPKVNSFVAERLQKLNANTAPLTFNVSGRPPLQPTPTIKKIELLDKPNVKVESKSKELAIVTEKKSTTTTTTSVKSKVENSQKTTKHAIGDKHIEETKKKSSTSEQVKVSSVTTDEAPCPKSGKPKVTVKKSIAKQEKKEIAEAKDRTEVKQENDKTLIKTTKSLKNENINKDSQHTQTKIDGKVRDDVKKEVTTSALKKVELKLIEDEVANKKSLRDARLNLTTKVKQAVKVEDNGTIDKTEKGVKATASVVMEKPLRLSRQKALEREQSPVKVEETPLKSALKTADGSIRKKKSVKLADIIIPQRTTLEPKQQLKSLKTDRPSVNFDIPQKPQPSNGFGLQKGKSEGNIAARVKSRLDISVKRETQDDATSKNKRDDWLFSATEEYIRQRDEFSFSNLKQDFAERRALFSRRSMQEAKEKLERRVMGDPTLDRTARRETIKIPNANLAMNKWKLMEKSGS